MHNIKALLWHTHTLSQPTFSKIVNRKLLKKEMASSSWTWIILREIIKKIAIIDSRLINSQKSSYQKIAILSAMKAMLQQIRGIQKVRMNNQRAKSARASYRLVKKRVREEQVIIINMTPKAQAVMMMNTHISVHEFTQFFSNHFIISKNTQTTQNTQNTKLKTLH